MNFNGLVGDLGNKPSETFYDISYRGKDLKGLEGYVKKRCSEKGVEVISVSNAKDGDGVYTITARVKSMVGIV